MRRSLSTLLILLAALAACRKERPNDPLCSSPPAPQTAELKAGQGAVQLVGAGSEYFYVRDPTNKQVASGSLNRAVGVEPGEYTLLLNNSTHQVFVDEGKLTKCDCGSVQVTGDTEEYYYVFDTTGKQLSASSIGKASSLFPGSYTVKVNNTPAPVTVKTGDPATLRTGSLTVAGATNEYFYVFDPAGSQLAAGSLQKRMALFPGTWTVKVNNTAVPAEVKPGESVSLPAGGLMVRGATEEYYYVFNEAGTQLAATSLNKALTLFPGAYRIKVNNSVAPAAVTADKTIEIATGTVTAKKAGGSYYYVYDGSGSQLAAAQVDRAMSLLPGQYTVRVDEVRKPATVTVGKDTALTW